MHNRFPRLSIVLILASLSAVVLGTGFVTHQSTKRKLSDHVAGELLVKFKDARDARADGVVRILGARDVLSVRAMKSDPSTQVVRVSEERLARAIDTLSADSRVAYAEPNYLYQALEGGLPNDLDLGKLWGLVNAGQSDTVQTGTSGSDIHVSQVWEQGITGSHQVVVAVIDTGVDRNHPELTENVFTNTGEIPGDGKDNDGNGFVDDVHGWNFAANSAESMDDNDHSHGTHCSGTIGARGNNGKGIVGVNWNVSILPIKFLDANGSGSLANAVEAIKYATKMHVKIMSNSWGGGGYSQAMFDAIQEAKKAGILFVAAAGNSSTDNDGSSPNYPSSYKLDNVLAVAATDNRDKLASFSSYGKTSVHVAAPGVRIYSSVRGGKYDVLSGTSMATPHVAGIAALLVSAHPEWSYSEIKSRLIATSDPIKGLMGKVVANGRVNTWNALNGITPPPLDLPNEADWRDVATTSESEHPYALDSVKDTAIRVEGAKFLRVVFERLEVEQGWDHVLVQDGNGDTVEDLTGTQSGHISAFVSGETLNIRLTSDKTVNGYGFKLTKVQMVPR